jgi:hypothetical protein
MKLYRVLKIGMLVSIVILSPCLSWARYQIESTPSISLSGLYDDNINLTNRNEESDYINSASPGINLNISSELNNLNFRYAPTFVRYKKRSQNDTVRHSGALSFSQDMAQNLRFELSDTYIKSEDPVEETEGVESIRSTRNIYQRNTGRAGFQYVFGAQNTVSYGYSHSLMENEDISLDDGTIQGPYANMSYWFNVKNGIEIDYQHNIAEFTRDDGTAAGDNYRGYDTGVRYIYRFNPQTTGNIGYNFSNRNFRGLTEDYDVREGSAGFSHSFSEDMSLNINSGYYVQKNEQTDDEDGYSYNASFVKRFERGSITLGGSGGWSDSRLEAERTGFTRNKGVELRYEYQLLEDLDNYAGGSLRRNKDLNGGEWKTIQVNYGFRWSFHRWYSLVLDYSVSARDDIDNTDDYNDNRITINFNASRLYRW